MTGPNATPPIKSPTTRATTAATPATVEETAFPTFMSTNLVWANAYKLFPEEKMVSK
jgi:hypothetical protein